MAKLDYYEVLGLEKTATQEKIKARYRELAKQFHPDKNPGNQEAETKFKQVNDAYEVLGNETQRSAYDRESVSMEKAARFVDAVEQVFSGVGALLREFGFGRRDHGGK